MSWQDILEIIKDILLPPQPTPELVPIKVNDGQRPVRRCSFATTLLLFFCLSIFSAADPSPEFVSDLKFKDLEIKIPKVNKEILNNQVSFYSLPSDNFPICFLTISLQAGEVYTSGKGVEIPTLLAGTLKFGGSTNFPKAQLITKLESLGAKLSFSSGDRRISIKVSFLSKDQDAVLALMKDLILEPSFDESAFTKAKEDLLETIKRRNDSTESIAFRKASELVYRKTQTGLPESIQSVSSIQKDTIIDFWNDAMNNKEKVVYVTGQYQEPSLKKFISTIFLPIKEEPKYKEEVHSYNELDVALRDTKVKTLIIDKDVNQSMILMVGILPAHNSPDFFALQVLNYIIGGSGFNSYMMQQIRVERGLAYSAISYPIFQTDHGLFYAYSLTKNQSLKEVHSLMKTILSAGTFHKITLQELEKAKIAINNKFVFLFTNNNRIISNQVRFDEHKMPDNYLQTYREKINSVSLDDLIRVGMKYYEFSNLRTIIVTPGKETKGISDSFRIINPEDNIPIQ
jgi:zinc protease